MKISFTFLEPLVSPVKEALRPLLKRAESGFYKLESRDRNALLALTLFLGVAILYYGVWYPVSHGLSEAEEEYRTQTELISWMKSHEAEAKSIGSSLSGSGGNKLSGSLCALANNVARQKSIALKRYEPDGNDKLRVWLEKVSFNDFVSWMQVLVSKGMVVSNVSVEGQDDDGKINAKIIFKRG